MKILFVASTMPLSKLIMWAFNEPASHFAVAFDDKWAIHSDLMGVGLRWYDEFKTSHQIVSALEPITQMTLIEEEALYQKVLDQVAGRPYDFGAFFYMGWRAALMKFLGIPMPSKNPWAVSGEYMCEEMAEAWGLYRGDDLAIMTPWKLRAKLLATGLYREVEP